jgi:hypothetical protein
MVTFEEHFTAEREDLHREVGQGVAEDHLRRFGDRVPPEQNRNKVHE